MAEEWRRVVATLADPARRQVYASILLGSAVDVPAKKLKKALQALVASGLIRATEDGYAANGDVFTELLAASPVIARTGVDRFIRDGRIEQYPMKAGDRLEVLEWARDRALPDGSEVSERELGERLAAMTEDVATLRRYLVDAGLVRRDAAGERYWREG